MCTIHAQNIGITVLTFGLCGGKCHTYSFFVVFDESSVHHPLSDNAVEKRLLHRDLSCQVSRCPHTHVQVVYFLRRHEYY